MYCFDFRRRLYMFVKIVIITEQSKHPEQGLVVTNGNSLVSQH